MASSAKHVEYLSKLIYANAFKMIGRMEGLDAKYALRRDNFVVYNGGKEESNLTKGELDDMNKTQLQNLQIDFIKERIRKKGNSFEFRITENKKNYSLCRKDYDELIRDVLANKHKKQRRKNGGGMTVTEFLNMYEKLYLKGTYARSTKLEHKNMRRHLEEAFGERKISRIKIEDLQSFINNIPGDVVRKKVYNFANRIFEKAAALKKITHNPCAAIALPYTKPKQQKTGLLYEQQVKLIAALDNYDFDFKKYIIASIILGTRAEETAALRLSDIVDNSIIIRGTKTLAAARRFNISTKMIELLKTNVEDDEIFKCQAKAYYHKLKKLYITLGIFDKDIHSLRHTCSANLYWLGYRDKQRQQILGHRSPQTTNYIYTWLEFGMTPEKVKSLYGPLYLAP